MKKGIVKIANKSFKKIFSTYKKDIDSLKKEFNKNMILFDSYLDEEAKTYWNNKLNKVIAKQYKPFGLKTKIAALATSIGVMVGYSACADSNTKKSKQEKSSSVSTQTIVDNTSQELIPEDMKAEEIVEVKSDIDLSQYAYDFHNFGEVSTELALLGDKNVLELNSWLAGSKNINEDSELLLKFYIAANHNVLYEPNSVYSSIIQKYTATDLYTSFFQVIDDLQVKAVFITGENDIQFSKYFISKTDREYLQNLENLLMNYNNAVDKSQARKELSAWVDQNVVRQDYGNVSKAAVIVSYRLIQNARLTNAVLNIPALDNVKDLDKVDDKYKTTTDYLVTKFLDSKEISCHGYVNGASKTTLSDDSIDFIQEIIEFHNTLFNQNSSVMTKEQLIEQIVSKRKESVKENMIKTDEELKEEYLKELKKVDPTNPVFNEVPTTGQTTIALSESEKASIRKQTESRNTSVVKDSNGNTLATGSSATNYDTAAYQAGYNAGSSQGAMDGASGKSKNATTSGKTEYVDGYRLGYNTSYDEAKAVYDRAVKENQNPKVTYEKVEDTTSKVDTSKTSTSSNSSTSTSSSTKESTSSSKTTSETTSFELSEGVSVDANGNLSYNGETIYLSEEDAEWIASMTGSYSSETNVKVYTK